MPDLGWLAAVLAVTVLTAAATSVGRVIAALLRGRRVHYGVDLTHALMGASMAGMFVANLSLLSTAIWQAAFAVVIGWYAIRAIIRSQHHNTSGPGLLRETGHLLSIAAMLYMLHAAPKPTTAELSPTHMSMRMTGTRMDAHPHPHPQLLSLFIATLLVGYAVLAAKGARRAAASEVVMCAAMSVMLVAAL